MICILNCFEHMHYAQYLIVICSSSHYAYVRSFRLVKHTLSYEHTHLFKKATVDKFIEQMTNQKKHHYGLIPLTPFIMSAGGCLGKEAEEFLQNCYDAIRNSPYQYDLPEFRRGITFRLAALLLGFKYVLQNTHPLMRTLSPRTHP